MLAKLLTQHQLHPNLPDQAGLNRLSHTLVLMPKADTLPADCPEAALLQATLKRQKKTLADLESEAISASSLCGEQSNLRVWRMLKGDASPFALQTAIREALEPLLDEEPVQLDILLLGDDAFRQQLAVQALYVGLVNSTPLPTQKQKEVPEPLHILQLWQVPAAAQALLAEAEAVAGANVLARQLSILPPNVLYPASYRTHLATLAHKHGWMLETYDLDRLAALKAGAFLAVAQGSPEKDAAIVRLRYTPAANAAGTPANAADWPKLALVGKGICFDTGGHNLKPAKYMQDMHEDMAGSASALGILLAASRLQWPVQIDAWLALSRNDIAPQAYRQADIVTAINGTTIEVVHTDAEGRMVLADTLTLAAREKPDLMLDFATLTGSMIEALGVRYSGIFATEPRLAQLAVQAGESSGERVCYFPMPEDYEEELESDVADIRQCSMESEADHILAARFLKRFTEDTPWLHLDLSAANCEGGLGAIGTNQTGFGVAWGMHLLKAWLQEHN